MPRFYFDTHDGERQIRDEDGIELQSVDKVPEEVMGLLRDLAHHELPVGRRIMATVVRDITGAAVYRATMTIKGERYG